jgi:hypothetical protein
MNEDDAFRDSIRRAILGDLSALAPRIESGVAHAMERKFASDVLMGREPTHNQKLHALNERDLQIANFVKTLVENGRQKKAAVGVAMEEYKLSHGAIYNALKIARVLRPDKYTF